MSWDIRALRLSLRIIAGGSVRLDNSSTSFLERKQDPFTLDTSLLRTFPQRGPTSFPDVQLSSCQARAKTRRFPASIRRKSNVYLPGIRNLVT